MYSFSDIIGQKEAAGHLQNAIVTGKLSHAYILCGEKGTGKEQLAYTAAAVLECSSPVIRDGVPHPCGKCHSCIQMESESHPDVIRIVHRKKNEADKQTALGIDDIREMRADVMIRPYSGDYKVYILPDAGSMTQQAQNALLKTLEEPPSYAVIFLLAEKVTSFLTTVLSRCVLLRMHSVPAADLKAWLGRKYGMDEQAAGYIAGLSHGNPGMAVRMAESDELSGLPAYVAGFLKNLASANSYEIVGFADRIVSGRIRTGGEGSAEVDCSTDRMLEWMQDWFRDILVYKSTRGTGDLIFYEDVQYIISAAERLSFEDLARIRKAFGLAEQRLRAGGNDSQILEMLLLTIRDCLQ